MRLAPLLLLLACKGADDTDPRDTDAADTDTDADSDADTDTDTDAIDTDTGPQAPTISALDAWCWQHTTGDERWLWRALAYADDPQGTVTLANFGHEATILRDGNEVITYEMICEDDGDCSASWNQDEAGVLCSEATAYTIRVRVEDDDGNWSEPIETQGRVGTDEAGVR